MMEKNGAIGRHTPSACCGGNCHNDKQAAALPGQLELFPQTDEEADQMEADTTKSAVDAVVDATRKRNS